MKPYSLDFRERVVELVNGGTPRAEVAEVLGIGLATLKRWLVLDRTCGDLRSTPPPGQPPHISPEQEIEVRALVAAHPDATLAEDAARWNATHTPSVSQWTIGRTIRALGLSRKKTRIASERDPWARALFAVMQEAIDPERLVVVDAFGSNLDVTRRYARAPEGARAGAAVPRNTPVNPTTIALAPTATLHRLWCACAIIGGLGSAKP